MYRGESVTVPVGLAGFNANRNPSKISPAHFTYVEGVDIDGGVITKEGGAELLTTTPIDGSILAGIHYRPAIGQEWDVIFVDRGDGTGDLLGDLDGSGDFATTLNPVNLVGTPANEPPFFMAAGGDAAAIADGDTAFSTRLFMFSDHNPPHIMIGDDPVMAVDTGGVSDWADSFPTFGIFHDSRVWAGGNSSDPHRIYYSTTGDQGDWSSAGSGSIVVFPGEGEKLVGGVSFRDLLILVKKPTGLYVIDTSNPTPSAWRCSRLNGVVGGISPASIVQKSNDILVLDAGGNFHQLTAVDTFSDINSSNLGTAVSFNRFVEESVSLINLQNAKGVWYAAKSKAYYMMPGIGATQNTIRTVIDYSDDQVGHRFLISRRDEANALWMRPDANGVERPVIGDEDGNVWLLDRPARNKDGVAYSMYFETSDIDFSFIDPLFASKVKNGAFLEIVCDVTTQFGITVIPSWDSLPSDSVSFTLGGSQATLDDFVLDADALGQVGVETQRERMVGSGRRLRLAVSNNALDEEVRISEMRVAFQVGDERTNQAVL